MPKVPEGIKDISQNLRKNMTIWEKELWKCIRSEKLGVKFLRQKPLYVYTENNWLDRFIIPDFICLSCKIIIEVDWNVHNLPEVLSLDKVKEHLIKRLWYRIIRVTNDEIKKWLDNVIIILIKFIKS